MRTALVVVAVLVPLALGSLAFGEKVDMSPKALRDTATHVVLGKVKAIYARVADEGDWRVTRSVAEVEVGDVEKGDGIAKGSLVYARYWTQEWIGRGMQPPGTSGHRGIPREGEPTRIFLARNAYDGFSAKNDDGGFNVIGANGFQPAR